MPARKPVAFEQMPIAKQRARFNAVRRRIEKAGYDPATRPWIETGAGDEHSIVCHVLSVTAPRVFEMCIVNAEALAWENLWAAATRSVRKRLSSADRLIHEKHLDFMPGQLGTRQNLPPKFPSLGNLTFDEACRDEADYRLRTEVPCVEEYAIVSPGSSLGLDVQLVIARDIQGEHGILSAIQHFRLLGEKPFRRIQSHLPAALPLAATRANPYIPA